MLKSARTTPERRQLGRYDTPRPLSQSMADWAIRSPEDEVLEPSSGSGVFVASAVHRLKVLRCALPQSHVWACDIDATACAETIADSHLLPGHMWHGDFLAAVDGTGFRHRRFDCIVGNPPFVSLHRMSHDQRSRAQALVERLQLKIDRKASLWAYFVAASVRAVKPGGRVALILPESALHAEYSRDVLNGISCYFSRCLLLSIRERCFLEGGAAERVVVILCDERLPLPGAPAIGLHESADVSEAQHFLGSLALGKIHGLPQLNGHAVPHLLPARQISSEKLSNAPSASTFAEFAQIKIGVVTGANDFFALTERERKDYNIPKSAVLPLLTRFRYCGGLGFSELDWQELVTGDHKCWLLLPNKKECRETVLEYLAMYPETLRKKNKTFAKRQPWHRPETGENPDAFLRYMGATAPRLAMARPQLTCTNTIHRVYFRPDLSDVARKAIILSLHSSYSQLSAEFEGRAYGSGVLKLEPAEARRVRLLLPKTLAKRELEARYARVEKYLRKGQVKLATAEIDEWLWKSTPGLAKTLSLASVHESLNLTVARRLGFSPKSDRCKPIVIANKAITLGGSRI